MHKKREVYDTNRSMKRKPRKHSGWCMSCDMMMVYDGQKCHVCGYRQVPNRNKKEDRI
jgi:hypothetical protein